MDKFRSHVFESGRFNRNGSIQGNDNDFDPVRHEPHHARISSPKDAAPVKVRRATTAVLPKLRLSPMGRSLQFGP